jgi:hypothetical protein
LEKSQQSKSKDHFRGNFNRDSVEVNLEKFLEVVNEVHSLKSEIRDLEIANQSRRYRRGVSIAKMVDAWRIFPRIFIGVYIVLLYQSVNWFMALEDPSNPQFSLVSVIVGAGAAWFGLYVRSRGDGEKD